jgi:hypothetical protein
MNRHRLDPVHLHHAAEKLGDIVAGEEMSDEDASAVIVSWVDKTTGVDRSGLQARLHWTMRDRAEATRRQRENVTTAIRWAVRPLFASMAPAAEIEEAAGRANGDFLEWAEVATILREEMTRALRSRRG